MKSFTPASVTAMLGICTHASAVQFYNCNGNYIDYSIILHNIDMGNIRVLANSSGYLASLPRPPTYTTTFQHKFRHSGIESTIIVKLDSSKTITEVEALIEYRTYECDAVPEW
ncbi:unnamed protein product [Blumeria hordei]|uniref:Uncharacterized protein n=1 Tax=Blumeria hordei TaxID=2867405 RepID=A0A383UVE1_BLUHO|nr:unnamed protein product [Blumeria hordei]